MAKGVRRGRLGDARRAHGLLHRPLQQFLVNMMATLQPAARIDRVTPGGENVLPTPGSVGGRILAFECKGQGDARFPESQIVLEDSSATGQMLAQSRYQRLRQVRYAILRFLAVANPDLPLLEIEILHPQANAFHQAHATAVEQTREQRIDSLHPVENALRLVAGQHHRQALWPLGSHDAVEPRQVNAHNLPVKEQQGRQRLVLGRRGHLAFHSQVCEKGLDFLGTHFSRMAFMVEENESPGPLNILCFGSDTIVLEADPVAELIE